MVECHSKVRNILNYWSSSKKISREKALDFQLKAILNSSNTNFAMKTRNLTSMEDRVDYLRCYRTKALFDDQTTTVGSAVMNSECESIGIKQPFGVWVMAAPPYVHRKSLTEIKSTSFLERIRAFFISRIEQFSKHLRLGTLRSLSQNWVKYLLRCRNCKV